MDQIVLRRAIPDYPPTHGPAVARTHFAAIHEFDAALRDFTSVHEQSRGPALMRLDVAIPLVLAVEQHVGPRRSRASDEVEDVIAIASAVIEEDLRSIGGQIGQKYSAVAFRSQFAF